MSFAQWRNWLNRSFGTPAATARTPYRRPGTGARLQCVALEDRVTPATFTPTTFADVAISSTGVVDAAGQITDQGNAITLRSAVIAANANTGADTITLLAGTYTLSITGNTSAGSAVTNDGDPTIGDLNVFGTDASDLTISGAGAGSTIIQQNASGFDRVFDVNETFLNTFDFTVQNLTIAGGRDFGSDLAGGGGAIYAGAAVSGTTTLSGVQFLNNTAAGSGAFGGGAVLVQGGSLTISNSTFGDGTAGNANSTTGTGGAVQFDTFGTTGTLTVTGSTFNRNLANGSSGSHGGAISIFQRNSGTTTATISGSTFRNNSADDTGGAIVIASATTVSLLRNTFDTNTSTGAGGAIGALGASGAAITTNFNRFVNNTTTTPANGNTISFGTGAGTFDANDNWWGSSAGPAANAIASGAGFQAPTVANFLQLKTTASPSTLVTNGTTTITSSFLTDSANNAVSTADLVTLIGLPISFSAVGGTLSGQQATIQAAGTATATYTATAAAASNSVTGSVDGGPASGSANTLSLTVNKANTTATVTSNTPNPSVTGQAITVTYTVAGSAGNSPTAPTGSVTISDGVNSATGTVSGGTASVTLFTAGTRTLTATYAGDTNFNGTTSSGVSQTVSKADTTTTITSDTPDPTTVGQSFTVNFTLSVNSPGSGTPTGTVTITDGVDSVTVAASAGTASIALNTPGTRTLTATYNGDANYNTSTSAGVSHTVGVATTTTVSDSPSGTSVYGQTVTFTATVMAGGSPVTSGSVTFTEGATNFGTVNLDTNGQASFMTSALTVTGSPHSILATYNATGNFNTSSGSVSHAITPATLTITANNDTKTYGTLKTFGATAFTQTGLVTANGDTITSVTETSTGAPVSATVAGSPYAIVPSAATGTGLSNYTITYVNGSLVVNTAALTITANNDTKTYGTLKTFSSTAFTQTGLVTVNGDTITSVTETSTGAPVSATVAGSPYAIVPSAATGTGLSNYTITYVNGALTVNTAALTITANDDSKTYGTLKTFGATAFTQTGLVTANGDTITSVTETSTGAPATATVAGSPYAIVPSAATGTGLSNYTITYVNGALTVNTAALTITANDDTKTYGTLKTFGATAFTQTGLVTANGDTITSVTETSTGSPVSATVAGSPYAIVPSAATGTGLSNYTITYVNGALTVNTAALTITANDDTKTYGTLKTFSSTAFTQTGLVTANGDTIASVTETSTGSPVSATVAGSPYAIVPSAATGTGLSNYTITYVNGALTVNTAALTITANDDSKTYGTLKTFGATAFTQTGLVTANGDTITSVTETSTGAPATAPVAGSPYAIVPSAATGTGLSNYTITYVNGSLVVNPAALTITADDKSKVYGAANPALTATYTGLANGEPSTVVTGITLSTTATASSAVGTYPITISGGTAANYTITLVNGTLTVNKAPLTITANDQSKVLNSINPPLTVGFSGFVNGDTSTVVSGLLLTTTAATDSPVGSYPITPGGATATNYAITFVPGTLTVTSAIIRLAAGTANGGFVRFFDNGTPILTNARIYGGYQGGVAVATGDINGDGLPDFITGTTSSADHVKVFDGVTGKEIRSFLAFAGFTGGISVGAGDINGDKIADIIVGAGPGAPGGHVKVFDGRTGALLQSFLSFPGFSGGVTVAGGDVNGDKIADIIVGAGPGAPGGHVKVFDGKTGAAIRSFLTFDGFSGGISVGGGDLNGDGFADIIVGSGKGSPNGHVKVFDGKTGAVIQSFFAFSGFTGGVNVAGSDYDGNGVADILVGTGPGANAVKVFGPKLNLLRSQIVTGDPLGLFVG